MSDIFQEVDEEVRRDKAAEFWKKYQNQILAGAVLIVLASAGFRYWQYEREKAAAGGRRPVPAGARGARGRQARRGQGRSRHDRGRKGRAAIARSRRWPPPAPRRSSDPQGAIGAFDAVAGDAAIDPLLRDAARLRAALLRVDMSGEQQKGEAALTSLSTDGRALPAHRAARARRARARTQGL